MAKTPSILPGGRHRKHNGTVTMNETSAGQVQGAKTIHGVPYNLLISRILRMRSGVVTLLALLCCSVGLLHAQSSDPNVQSIVNAVIDTCSRPTSIAVLKLDGSRPVVASRNVRPTEKFSEPGSSVKPILAWLAASKEVLSAGESIVCTGTTGEPRCFANHGRVDLRKALATSCNAFAFELAGRLGAEQIVQGFADFGFPRLDTALPNTLKAAWSYGTGHHPCYLEPAQLVSAYARLIDSLFSESSTVNATLREEILDGMRLVVEGAEGTAPLARNDRVTIAGKTGTGVGVKGGAGERTSSWFVGYAPVDRPRYIVVVSVLDGTNGGTDAAPIAREVLIRLLK